MKATGLWNFISRSRVRGSLLFVLGYILSPLSWWNDVFVNLPLAYALGSLAGLLSRRLFLPAMVLAYWGTNILGLVLMSKGAGNIIRPHKPADRRKELIGTLALSAFYTIAVILLVRLGILKAAFNWRQKP